MEFVIIPSCVNDKMLHMNRRDKKLVKDVFRGNDLSYEQLMRVQGLRHEVSQMGTVEKTWMLGFSSLYTNQSAPSFEKKFKNAALKVAKEEFDNLQEDGNRGIPRCSLEQALQSKERIGQALSAGGHKFSNLSLFGSALGSPERKIDNIIVKCALRDSETLMRDIGSKLKKGENVDADLEKMGKIAECAASHRSFWNGNVKKVCTNAVNCELHAAITTIGKSPDVTKLGAAAAKLEALEGKEFMEYADKSAKQNAKKARAYVKDIAIDAIEKETKKSSPDISVIKSYARLLNDNQSLKKLLTPDDWGKIRDATEEVKKDSIKEIKANHPLIPTTYLTAISEILTMFRGQSLSFAAGRP